MSITNEQLLEWAINKYDRAISEGKDNNGLVEMIAPLLGEGINVDFIKRDDEEIKVAVYVNNHPTMFTTYFGLNDFSGAFYHILRICYAMEEVFGDE